MRVLTLLSFPVLLALSVAHAQSVTGQGTTPAPTTIKKLSRAEFDALARTPSRLLVLDVRRPDELTSIGGFPVYLSIQLGDLGNQLAYIPKDRAIVTVSNHANRAQRAGEQLKKEGFNVVGAIGVQDYEGEGGKLVKIAPPATRPDAKSEGTTSAQH
jgi:rhodanese-related sulfurtransferase